MAATTAKSNFPIIPILVIALIMGGAYYYLVVMKKKPATEKGAIKPNTDENKADYQATIAALKAKGYNDEEIAQIIDSESFKNGSLNY